MLYKDKKSVSPLRSIAPVCPLRPVTRITCDGRTARRPPPPPRCTQESLRKVSVWRPAGCGDISYSPVASEPEDVIEVNPSPVERGPVHFFKRRGSHPKCYHPNPRLYPGPTPRRVPKSKKSKKSKSPEDSSHQPRHRKRCLRRPVVPNARLYKPPPKPPLKRIPRPVPPASPIISWQPSSPGGALKAASSVALELAAQRQSRYPNCPSSNHRCVSPPIRSSKKLKGRRRKRKCVKGGNMAAGRPAQSSASADDGSDGNETLSAPSEFLAEFLSAIMRREYVEALKYCRLILQYEPHNATARGFYPLLRHKLQAQSGESEGEDGRADWSPEPRSGSDSPPSDNDHDSNKTSLPDHMAMDHSADSSSSSRRSASGSLDASRRSSLDLDSSPESSSNELQDPTFSSGSGSRWDSSGSSPPDDNGNTHADVRLELADDENDNTAAGDDTTRHDTARHDNQPALATDVTETESWSSLRRLRARFAAIK